MDWNVMHVLRLTGNSVCRTAIKWGLLGVVALLAVSGAARAQAPGTGTIFGSVTDPSGAVIPGATVLIEDPAKGFTRMLKSNKAGEFNIPALQPAKYTLTVTANGFQTYVADSIQVDADANVKITAKLTVGDKGETVTVNGEGTAIDTKSATVATLIDQQLVESLPIDGNNPVALASLLPGVTDLNAPATNTNDRTGSTYSVSGSRNTQNLMLFDGLMWNNLFFNTGIQYPPPNALQEISVLLNNFKAQYGRNAGSVFNVVTKSGSNQFHGAVWDYFQNAAFNASDYLSHKNPKDNSNQVGFTVTGPIKRDKAYFAVTFQDLIQKLEAVGVTPVQGYLERGLNPDGTPHKCATAGPASWQGLNCANFGTEITTVTRDPNTGAITGTSYSKLLNPITISSTSGNAATPDNTISMMNYAWAQAGHTGQNPCIALLNDAAVYAATHAYLDGKIGANLPNAEVPTTCFNPVMQNVINTYVPLPNGTSASSSTPSGTIPANISSAPQPKNDKNLLARIDLPLNAHHTLDMRYNLINANDATAPGVTSQSVGIASYQVQYNQAHSHFGNIGDTWVVTPNIVNVARLGYKRYTLAAPPLDHHTWADFGGDFAEPLTIPVMPTVNWSGQYRLGAESQANYNTVNENVEFLEQLNWTKGKHNYQFGFNYLRLQYLNRQDYPGSLAYSSTFTGVSFADGAMGLVNSVTAKSPLVQGGINHTMFFYAQDDWRATAKLTLNLGVRYELPFQWYQPNGYSSTFRPGVQSTVFPNAIAGLAFPGDKGVLNSLVPTDFNGLVPRLGMAYDVFGNGKLALRAGGGMFFDAINAQVIGVGEPFFYQVTAQLPPGGASVPLAALAPDGVSKLVLPNGYNKANPQFQAPYSLFYPDRNFRTPYYIAMNAGFEYQVVRSGVLDVNYVGKLGRKLTVAFDQNPAIFDCSGGYYQADPVKYCTGASSNAASTKARLRYSPFNYGGGGLVDFATIGSSNYNGLQAQYTQRGGRLLTLLMSYTYSKAIDLSTNSTTLSNTIPNVFDITSERGISDYDARHILNMGWRLTPPRVKNGGFVAKTVLNNWIYSGQFQVHSGRPFSVTINNDTALVGEPNQRAAILPGRSPYLPSNRHRIDKVREYFNTDAFTYPALGTFSNVPRNAFVGPGYLMTNMNLARQFSLAKFREGMRLQFRADAFNVFNTPNLANPRSGFSCSSTSITVDNRPGVAPNPNAGKGCTDKVNGVAIGAASTTFGVVQSTYGNNANTSTNGRKMQFVMTVFF